MKRLCLAARVATLLLFTNNINAQCPIIVRTSFLIITDNSNTCFRQVPFNYIGQSNGTPGLNVCIDASHSKDEEKNYTSPLFTAFNIAAK